MKRCLFLMSFLLVLLNANFSYAQTKSSYIYIEIPGLTIDRGFPEFRQALSSISEVNSIQYCEKLGIAILFCSNHESHLERTIAHTLTKSNYKFQIKNQVPIESILDKCDLKF